RVRVGDFAHPAIRVAKTRETGTRQSDRGNSVRVEASRYANLRFDRRPGLPFTGLEGRSAIVTNTCNVDDMRAKSDGVLNDSEKGFQRERQTLQWLKIAVDRRRIVIRDIDVHRLPLG